MDPMTLIMLGMIALLIIFMIRNGKKRREQIANLQAGVQPGAEVMLQAGIFGVVEDIDEEEQKVTVRSGTSLLIVHRSAVTTIVTPIEARDTNDLVAPDDDPSFNLGANEALESPETRENPDGDPTDRDKN